MNELLEKLKAALSDRYDVEREIGEGGMATVFLASDVRHGRKVAIKVLHEDLGAAVGAERFRREIQIATSLTHPHILALYDSGEAAGSLFYVMPFIEGESLRHRMDREKQLPIDQALKITGEVASALAYAHRKGIVHRDIKPENILLEDGHAIVADFGIARAVMGDQAGALTKTGMSLGTPTYMSPEQAFAEKDIDGRSDMYSLACVLFEMLTGEPPFTGPNAQAIMARHSMSEVPSMQIVRNTVPDEVEAVVERALAKAPADRFATIEEFAAELEECVIDYHTTTRRAITERRSGVRTPPGRRKADLAAKAWWKRPVAIAAIAAIVLAAGGSAWWFTGRGSSADAATGGLSPTRVAVLYFDDVSPNGQLKYMADGLTETLIDELSEVPNLDVVSKGGVGQFRDSNAGIDSIAHALEAGTLVRGSVDEAGDKLRVSVIFIDGNSGADLERKSFEQPKGDVFSVRDALAGQVSDFLRKRVGEEVSLKKTKAGTSNVAAWTLLQRAEKLRKDGENLARAADTAKSVAAFAEADSLLQQAERLDDSWVDPIISRARVALSRSLAAGGAIQAKPWLEQGIAEADRAIAKDPRNSDALTARGILRYRQWALALYLTPKQADELLDAAEKDLKTAVEIRKSNAEAWSQLSQIYNQKDDMTGALVAMQNAYQADAYLAETDKILWRLYATSYDVEHFLDAVKWCDEGARRFPANPSFVRCRLWLYTTSAREPNPADAWKDYEHLKEVSPPNSWPYQQREAKLLVAAALARANLQDSARKVIESARTGSKVDPEGNLLFEEAFVRTLFKTAQDTDEAFNLLRRYFALNPAHRAGFANTQSWWWRDLKQNPRFKDLVSGV